MKKIIISIGIGSLFYGLSIIFLTPLQAKTVGLVAMLVAMWSTHALPLGVVSLLPILLFPALGILPLSKVASNYSKPIIFLFIGGFLLAIAMQKSGLCHQISQRLLRVFPASAQGVLYGMTTISALLSTLLSNTTVTMMLLSIALYLTDNHRLQVRILLAVAYGASIGGILTPIGTPPNLFLLGYLPSIGMEPPTFVQWMLMGAPIVAGMLIFVPWLLGRGVDREPILVRRKPLVPWSREQKRLLVIFFLLALLLLINTPIHPWYDGLGLNEKGLLLGAGLLLFLPKIELLNWEDSRAIPYEILFLFGAGYAIAQAFSTTHLAHELAQGLQALHGLPIGIGLLLIALGVSFATEITSNTALTAIMVPVIAQLYGDDPLYRLEALMVATVAASYAFMLPIATPPNAIVMSAGVIAVRTMVLFGVVIDLVGVLLVAGIAHVVWPWILR